MAPSKAATKGQGGNQRLKVVVRKLPPDLPAAVFWRTTAQWVTREDQPDETALQGAERVTWSQFRPGKIRRAGKDKDSVNSRAYITFKSPEALVAFHKGYEGWAFRDKSGTVHQAVVEFAPYQRTPAAPAKADPRQGTIDDDAEFVAFKEALAAAPIAPQLPTETRKFPYPQAAFLEPCRELTPSRPTAYEAPKSTPLLDHLRQQKAASRAARKQAKANGSSSSAATGAGANGNGKGKGKSKMPAVLPGATKAQLATAAQGGVQAAAAPTKGGKGGKKEKVKKDKAAGGADAAAGGSKSKETSRSGTPVPSTSAGGAAPAGKGKNAATKPKKPKKERGAAAAAPNAPVAASTPSLAASPSTAVAPTQQPSARATPAPPPTGGVSNAFAMSPAEIAMLEQHRQSMQQRLEAQRQQQTFGQAPPTMMSGASTLNPAAVPVFVPGQLPRPGPVFVPAHLKQQQHQQQQQQTAPAALTPQPGLLRPPGAGILSVAGAGAQQAANAATDQQTPEMTRGGGSGGAKRGRGGQGRGRGGGGGEGGRGRGRGRGRGAAAAASGAP